MTSQASNPRAAHRRSPRARRRRRLWILLASAVGLAALAGAAGGWFLNLDLPDVRALEDYRPPTLSRLLAADGTVLKQFAVERRIVIPYSEIPPVLRNAIVAVEDSHFFRHVGVDPLGIARAVVKDLLSMSKEEGASTITQQLTRGLFLKPDKTWRRKVREMALAMQIERAYTKEEIFTLYVNQVNFGHGYYGAEAASQFYFGHPARTLTLPEAALLAGVVQRPTSLSPIRFPQRALARRNHVLRRMLEEGYITPQERDAAQAAPLGVTSTPARHDAADYFVEEVRRDLDARIGSDALYSAGLSIETGLDPALQREAERALDRGVRAIAKRRAFRLPSTNLLKTGSATMEGYRHPDWGRPVEAGTIVTGLVTDVDGRSAAVKVGDERFEVRADAVAWTGRGQPDRIFRRGDVAPFLVKKAADGSMALELSAEPTCDGAVLAMDPSTGEIRALVGGLDFARSQFDRAVQAQRQPGSAFKPIIYAAAVEEGWSATDLLMDEPTVFVDPQTGGPYQPENYYRDYNGLVTVRHALEHSLNIATIRMLNQVGYERAAAQAQRMGITSKIRPYPAMGLGASEVSMIELVTAYAVFPNLGTLVRPRFHTRVRSHDDETIEEIPASGTDVMQPETAYLMTSLLKGVIARGTGNDAAFLGEEIAGKTGTTDDNTDAWFVGFTPSLVLAVWVGKDDKEPLGAQETGSRAALPIWIEIMKSWVDRHPGETFRKPPGIETVPVDAVTGLKAGVDTGCATVILEDFAHDRGAPSPCSRWAHARASLPYYLQRYAWLDEETLALTTPDLSRILRESPSEVSSDGRHALLVQGRNGPVRVRFRIVPPDDPALAAFAPGTQASGPRASRTDSYSGLFFPADLLLLEDTSLPHPTVGLDARTAARITIRYP